MQQLDDKVVITTMVISDTQWILKTTSVVCPQTPNQSLPT